MKKIILLSSFALLYAVQSDAQLPSERKMSAIAPKYLVDGNKSQGKAVKPLASEAKAIPRQDHKLPGNTKRRTVVKGTDPKKLPSNSKKPISELAKKPKVKN